MDPMRVSLLVYRATSFALDDQPLARVALLQAIRRFGSTTGKSIEVAATWFT